MVSVWGKEVSRGKTAADGRYKLENVPLAAHLAFTTAGSTVDRTILLHDARISDLQQKIWSTEFAGKEGSLGSAFPADYFKMLRDLAKETTIDAELGK